MISFFYWQKYYTGPWQTRTQRFLIYHLNLVHSGKTSWFDIFILANASIVAFHSNHQIIFLSKYSSAKIHGNQSVNTWFLFLFYLSKMFCLK